MNMKARATPSIHSDPAAVGFMMETSGGRISYVSDTELHPDIVDAHKGARILILATTRPLYSRISGHLSTEDASMFAERIEPEVCILTHLGKKALVDGPEKQARWIQDSSGVDTIAAFDGMVIEIDSEISYTGSGTREGEVS